MSTGAHRVSEKGRHAAALLESLPHVAEPSGRDLLARTRPYAAWQDQRCASGLCPYPNSPAHSPDCTPKFQAGRPAADLDFASRDPLGLAASALVHQGAARAVRAAGARAQAELPRRLACDVGEWLERPHVVLFESGLDARFHSLAALLRRSDYVVLDRRVDAGFAAAARSASANVLIHEHLDLDELRAQLCEIRARAASEAVLVVTQSLFPLESDAPDLPQLQAICRDYEAKLLVDASFDLGVRGPAGTGQLGVQGMQAEVDLVLGSFAGALVSNLAFLATGSREAAEFVKFHSGAHVVPHAPSAIHCAVAAQALRIVRSEEGDRLRDEIAGASEALRGELAARGIPCLGDPMPFVVVHLGWEGGARLVSALLQERCVFANLLEHPVVPVGAARLCLQVPSRLGRERAARAAEVVAESVRRAWELIARS
jgi:glycine C-acetyltransferase